MRIATVLAALVAALALVAAGCGGGSEEAGEDTDTTAVTETTTDETTTDETTTDEGTTDDGGFSGVLADEDCLALAAAGASFAQAFATGTGSSEDAEELEELASKVPDEIEDDVRTLAEAYAKYAAELKDIGIDTGQTPTAEQLQALQAALASFDQQAVTAASERLAAWAQENCPGS